MKRLRQCLRRAAALVLLAGCADSTTAPLVDPLEVRVSADTVQANVSYAYVYPTVTIVTEFEVRNTSRRALELGFCPIGALRTEQGATALRVACTMPGGFTGPVIGPGETRQFQRVHQACLSGNCGPRWELNEIAGRYRIDVSWTAPRPIAFGNYDGAVYGVAVSNTFVVVE